MVKRLLLSFFVGSAMVSYAQAAVDDRFEDNLVTYIVKSDSTVGILAVDSEATSLQLKENVRYNGDTYTVVAVEPEAFYYSEVADITLPATIKSIGKRAFGSSKVKSVVLPKQLKFIDDFAFYACRELTSIEIPEGVTALGATRSGSAFGSCSKLKTVILPSTLDTIWDATFYHNSALKEIVLPEHVSMLGTNAFHSCDSLQKVTLSANLHHIADGAFAECKQLKAVSNISDKLESIGEEAFLNCPISTFTIPAGCSKIGDRAFSGTQISAFEVSPENQHFKLVGKALYTADKSLLTAYPPMASDKEVRVEEGCAGISAGAFMGAQLDKVILPESVVAIGDFAFCLSALSSIEMTDNVVYIGQQAFAGSQLVSVVLPQSLGRLNDATFAGCESLKTVTVPGSVKQIGIRQFWRCTGLEELRFLGYHAPEVDFWEYDTEAPFWGIAPESVSVTCPKGRAAAYEANFGEYAEIKSVVDSEAGILNPSAVTPADGAELAQLDQLAFSFDDEVELVTERPAIALTCGKLVAGVPVGETVKTAQWALSQTGKKELVAKLVDGVGGAAAPVVLEKGKAYYVVIPAGIFKDGEGQLNEQMLLGFQGIGEATGIEHQETSAVRVVKQGQQLLVFAPKASVEVFDASGKLVKSVSGVSGVTAVSGLSRGMHIVRVNTAEGIVTQKVLF